MRDLFCAKVNVIVFHCSYTKFPQTLWPPKEFRLCFSILNIGKGLAGFSMCSCSGLKSRCHLWSCCLETAVGRAGDLQRKEIKCKNIYSSCPLRTLSGVWWLLFVLNKLSVSDQSSHTENSSSRWVDFKKTHWLSALWVFEVQFVKISWERINWKITRPRMGIGWWS